MSFFHIYPNFSKERLVYNICSRKELVNEVRVAAITETASQKAYLLCPKPCFRRRNWVTDEDGVSVPKEPFLRSASLFCAKDLPVMLTSPVVMFSSALRKSSPIFIRDRHRLSEVCTNRQKKEPSFKTVVSLLSISDTAFLFRFNLYNGNVNDNIKLNPGHVVEHFRFDFLQKDFKMILMEL